MTSAQLDPDTIFAYCDRDGDGKLNRKEFLQALRCAGACPTAADFEEVCREHGTTPEYPAYRAALEVMLSRRPTAEVLAEKLGGLAQDGLVDAEALRFIATNFGERLNEEELTELMRLAEPDPEGNVAVTKLAQNLLPEHLASTSAKPAKHKERVSPADSQNCQEPSPQLAMELKESHGGISAGAKDKAAISYSRKAFKWTKGNHKTDEAWFRQELTYLPPPTE
eukprot:symbB.v1.2.029155.t1/scaffold3143.1/size62517/4